MDGWIDGFMLSEKPDMKGTDACDFTHIMNLKSKTNEQSRIGHRYMGKNR